MMVVDLETLMVVSRSQMTVAHGRWLAWLPVPGCHAILVPGYYG